MGETKGQMTQRHKREVKALKKETDALLHGVPKKDKKKRDEMNGKVKEMERELSQRHKDELHNWKEPEESDEDAEAEEADDSTVSKKEKEELEGKGKGSIVGVEDIVSGGLYASSSSSSAVASNQDDDGDGGHGKQSKAAKRRAKKQQQHQEKLEMYAAEREKYKNVKSPKQIEIEKITNILSGLGLKTKSIPGDGHCLYNAVLHQYAAKEIPSPYSDLPSLREAVGAFLLNHRDEYAPFIDTDDFDKYCDDVKNTSAWGGHVELQVLSKLLSREIDVYSANSSTPMKFGEEFSELLPHLQVSFHEHYLELGEHYNSVVDKWTVANDT